MMAHAFVKICLVLILNGALSNAGYTGKYTPWREVGKCSRKATGPCSKSDSCCDKKNAIRTFIRTCKGPGECDPNIEHERERPCKVRCSKPVTGKYGPWEEVGSCSRASSGPCSGENTCCNKQNAVRTFIRPCRGPGACDPNQEHERIKPCKVKCSTANPGVYGPWEEVGSCSRRATGPCSGRNTCCTSKFNGFRKFIRPCLVPGTCNPNQEHERERNCYMKCEDKAEWSTWAQSGGCVGACGHTGVLTYTRECQPGFGTCYGNAERTEDCAMDPCIVNGGFTDFSGWSACSVSCGGGQQQRSRTCTNPAPANGGADCVGDVTEVQACNSQECPKCSYPTALGMQDGRIQNYQITASSSFMDTHPNWQPSVTSHGNSWFSYNGRLHSGTGWHSGSYDHAGSWLQVDLLSNHMVAGIVTQGRGDGAADQHVKSYRIQYRKSGEWNLKDLGQAFQGSYNSVTPKTTTFPTPIEAQVIRIVVQSYQSHPVMRVEILGCRL